MALRPGAGRFQALFAVAALCLVPFSVLFAQTAAASPAGHEDPVAPLLIAVGCILLTAKLGGELFERLGQPPVLGELVFGILLGNIVLLNPSWTFFEPLRSAVMVEGWAVAVDMLARLGVIILLFEIGFESTLGEMRRSQRSSASEG